MGSFVSSYAKREIFLAASSTKHLVKLFPTYTRKKNMEIVVSPNFSRRLKFCQKVLKTVSASDEAASPKILLQELF